jgi:hypothetical protein
LNENSKNLHNHFFPNKKTSEEVQTENENQSVGLIVFGLILILSAQFSSVQFESNE